VDVIGLRIALTGVADDTRGVGRLEGGKALDVTGLTAVLAVEADGGTVGLTTTTAGLALDAGGTVGLAVVPGTELDAGGTVGLTTATAG